MWLIEQISRKQKANCVRPSILRHLLYKYYPWILVLETRIYIKHDSERCQTQLTPASVSPERGLRRNSLACVPLYDFPPEAIPAEQWGRKYIINLPLLIHFLVDSFQTVLHPFPPCSPFCISPRLGPFEAFKDVSVSICQRWVDSVELRGMSE